MLKKRNDRAIDRVAAKQKEIFMVLEFFVLFCIYPYMAGECLLRAAARAAAYGTKPGKNVQPETSVIITI